MFLQFLACLDGVTANGPRNMKSCYYSAVIHTYRAAAASARPKLSQASTRQLACWQWACRQTATKQSLRGCSFHAIPGLSKIFLMPQRMYRNSGGHMHTCRKMHSRAAKGHMASAHACILVVHLAPELTWPVMGQHSMSGASSSRLPAAPALLSGLLTPLKVPPDAPAAAAALLPSLPLLLTPLLLLLLCCFAPPAELATPAATCACCCLAHSGSSKGGGMRLGCFKLRPALLLLLLLLF